MSTRESEIRSGARTNALGLVGKLAAPAFLILVNRLYGVEVFGVYVTAASLVEMGIAFLTAGFRDAALLFVARHSDDQTDSGRAALYQGIVNALAWGLLLSVLLIVFTLTAGVWLVPRYFAEFGEQLLVMLRWMVLLLPLMTFERIVLGATQGLKIMKYEAAINGLVRPVLLVALAAGLWFVWPSIIGLLVAYVVTQIIVGLLTIWIYGRELSWSPLGRAIRTFRPSREMILFALPQNLNRTLERFITNIDVVMLGLFSYSAAAVGLYGAGALIVREIRHIKLVFSSSFAPHIVQLHFGRQWTELSRAFSQTTRWVTTWSIPALIAVALLRNDLLRIVNPDFGGEDTAFMLVLLVIPYLQASLGLAGNVVVMTGHSGYNLFNSTTAAVLNVLLNLWWIPILGPLGAALASAVAAVVTAALATGQMVFVVRARPLIREIISPHLAGVAGVTLIGGVALFAGYLDEHLPGRLAVLALSLAVYFGTLRALRSAGLGLSAPPT